MSDIIYPTLDLFIYDLRNGLGETREQVNQSQVDFLKKLPESIHPFLLPKDRGFEVDYAELLGKNQTADFEAVSNSYSLSGYYYPVRINDVYGLLLDCSVDDQSSPQPAECFARLKAEIEQDRLQGEQPTLGQTWMISGWLPEGSTKTPAEIAQACYAALMADASWESDKKGQGKLMGADIFELWRYRIVMEEDTTREATIQDIQDNQHIIIIIYPDIETAKLAAEELYSYWMKLFCYRHKILWCYGQSRLLKKDLKGYFTTVNYGQLLIREDIKRGRELEGLNKMLQLVQDTFYSYTIDFENLDFQIRTLDINLDDYQEQIVRLTKKTFKENAGSETELDFLTEFSEKVTNKYRLQISKDIENLQKGMKLLNEVITAAASRVEVEKAARDKNFQELLTNLGVGWAVGSFVAERQSHTNNLPENIVSVETIKYYIILLGPPVIAAIVAALLFWLGKRLLARSDVLSELYSLTVGKVVDKSSRNSK